VYLIVYGDGRMGRAGRSSDKAETSSLTATFMMARSLLRTGRLRLEFDGVQECEEFIFASPPPTVEDGCSLQI
jgi:hypothetical protein